VVICEHVRAGLTGLCKRINEDGQRIVVLFGGSLDELLARIGPVLYANNTKLSCLGVVNIMSNSPDKLLLSSLHW
jgi:hypothetical protein